MGIFDITKDGSLADTVASGKTVSLADKIAAPVPVAPVKSTGIFDVSSAAPQSSGIFDVKPSVSAAVASLPSASTSKNSFIQSIINTEGSIAKDVANPVGAFIGLFTKKSSPGPADQLDTENTDKYNTLTGQQEMLTALKPRLDTQQKNVDPYDQKSVDDYNAVADHYNDIFDKYQTGLSKFAPGDENFTPDPNLSKAQQVSQVQENARQQSILTGANSSVFKNFKDDLVGTFKDIASVPKQFAASIVSPDDKEKTAEQQQKFTDTNPIMKVVDAVANPFLKVGMRIFSGAQPALQDIASTIAKEIVDKNPNGLVSPEVKATVYKNIDPVLDKTTLQNLGDLAQGVLTYYMPEFLGSGALEGNIAKDTLAETLSSNFAKRLPSHAVAGIAFGTAQILSEGTTDPKEIASTLAKSMTGAVVLGGALDSAVPTGAKAWESLRKDITKRYNLPSQLYIDPAAVSRNLPGQEEAFYKAIGLTDEQARQAKDSGATVSLPIDTFVRIADKPWFAKVKTFFNIDPVDNSNIIRGEGGPNVTIGEIPESSFKPEAPTKESLAMIAREVSNPVKPAESPEFRVGLDDLATQFRQKSNEPLSVPENPDNSKSYTSADEFVKDNPTIFHGTKANVSAIKDLNPVEYGDAQALYGPGVYVTDNKSVAGGYSKTKGKGIEGKILSGKINPDTKLLLLDEKLSPEASTIFNQIINRERGDLEAGNTDVSGKTGAQAVKIFQEELSEAHIPKYEGHEEFMDLQQALDSELGYKGFMHRGGIGKGLEHNVAILFDYGQHPHNIPVTSLDENGNPIDTTKHGTTDASGRNEGLRESSQRTGSDDRAGRERLVGSVRRNIVEAAGRLSGHAGEDGEGAELLARHGQTLSEGKPTKVDDKSVAILREAGFPSTVTDKLSEAEKAGGVKNVVITDAHEGNENYVGAYKSDTLYLNPTEIDHPSYQDGSIVNHELAGHSWYLKLDQDARRSFYNDVKDNKPALKQAWETSDNPHKGYWARTVAQIREKVLFKSNEAITSRIMDDFGLVSNGQMSLDAFIDESLNLDKTIAAINAELARIGREPIDLESHNTQAALEHVAMLAERSGDITGATPAIENYLDDIQAGTLKYGPQATSQLVTQEDVALSLKTLEKLKGRTTVSKQFISDLTNAADLKQQERDIIRDALKTEGDTVNVLDFSNKVRAELLPLERNTPGKHNSKNPHTGLYRSDNSRYESINLPDDVRGNVENYKENIYESPIKTSAGEIHFSGDTKNYFGHSRTEDISDGKTRRVIEIQSDLFQKGRLENELSEGKLLDVGQRAYLDAPGNLKDSIKAEREAMRNRRTEISKLQQYTNPTAHFRMVREEIKQAAKDGKTALQFPTGETAMKIEGLGQTNVWSNAKENSEYRTGYENTGPLEPEDLQVGKAVKDHMNEVWVIVETPKGFSTPTSENYGKFKAVPKDKWDAVQEVKNGTKKLDPEGHLAKNGPKAFLENNTEAFDISGKVDTNNPIYRFYEKDLGRYLKNNYDAKPVTDAQGVTWYEVPIKPEMATEPVTAFRDKNPEFNSGDPLKDVRDTLAHAERRVGAKSVDPVQLENMLSREKQSLAAYEKNPAMHEKAYGRNKKPIYEAKIAELKDRIHAVEKATNAQIPKINVSGKDIELTNDLQQEEISLQLDREALENNPLKDLLKYVQKRGNFAGQLPEVTGETGGSKFKEKGDDIIDNILGHTPTYADSHDSEQVRVDMQEYLQERQNLAKREADFVKAKRAFIQSAKDDIALSRIARSDAIRDIKDKMTVEQKKQNAAYLKYIKEENDEIALEKMARKEAVPEQIISLSDVEPPEVRGGLASPKLDFENWHDLKKLGTIRMNRDTFERNVEKVAPRADAEKIKKFMIDPIAKNDFNKVEAINADKKYIKEKIVDEIGLRTGTRDNYLARLWADGELSEEDLKSNTENPEKVKKAAQVARAFYDHAIDLWNDDRKPFDYDPVPKIKNYTHHMDDITFFSDNFGFLKSNNELPTSIVGKTQFFKPGKIFSNAELRRTGKNSTVGLIEGLNKYIESYNTQRFHIDSIQRGRALENYLELVSETSETLNQPLQLQNFKNNLNEYVDVSLGRKTASLDRAVEKNLGRGVIKTLKGIEDYIGRNIIIGNLSAVMSHLVSIPMNAATVDKVPFTKGIWTTLVSPLRKDFSLIDGQKSEFLTRRYPTQNIDPRWWENTRKVGNFVMETLDQFKSRLAVSSKYFELTSKGVNPSDAMKQADEYAKRIIGSNSYGEVPNLFNNKSLALFTQFQRGINDGVSVLMHDIPYENEGQKAKIVWKLLQFAIFSFLLNQMYKKIRGSGKGIDPIDWGLTLTGLNEEGQGDNFIGRLGSVGKDIAGELPFTSFFTGNFPVASTISDIISAKGLKGKLEELATIASPFGGGVQAKKTITGLQDSSVGATTGQKIKAAIFGATNDLAYEKVADAVNKKVKSAQTQLDAIDSNVSDPASDTWKQVKKLGINSDQSQELVKNLSDEEYAAYKLEIAADSDYQLGIANTAFSAYQKADELGFDSKEAQDVVDNLSDSEYTAYKTVASALKNATSTTWDKQTIGQHIAIFAKAYATSPETAFDDLFHGDWRIVTQKNGQIIVERMPENASEAVKKKAAKDNSKYKLDHTVPLEIGGTNRGSNLQILTTQQWASNTPVEDYLGKALQDGKITGSQAREYAIRFKKGLGEPMNDDLESEYKEKYDSQPLTFAQIKDLVK